MYRHFHLLLLATDIQWRFSGRHKWNGYKSLVIDYVSIFDFKDKSCLRVDLHQSTSCSYHEVYHFGMKKTTFCFGKQINLICVNFIFGRGYDVSTYQQHSQFPQKIWIRWCVDSLSGIWAHIGGNVCRFLSVRSSLSLRSHQTRWLNGPVVCVSSCGNLKTTWKSL